MASQSLIMGDAFDFHDYFVMAPLKPEGLITSWMPSPNFHDYFVMAPLKLRIIFLPFFNTCNFHDYFVMAPLKLTALQHSISDGVKLP